jgi:hypothetical protein
MKMSSKVCRQAGGIQGENMNRVISIAVLIVGIVLIIYGLAASDSVSSGLSRLLTGSPTQKTIALLCSGAVFAVLGGYGLTRPSDKI